MTKSNRFGLLFLSDHHHNNKILEPLHIFISIILHIIICKSEYSMRITFEEIPNNFAYSVFSRHFKAMLDKLNKAYKLKLCLNIEKSCNFWRLYLHGHNLTHQCYTLAPSEKLLFHVRCLSSLQNQAALETYLYIYMCVCMCVYVATEVLFLRACCISVFCFTGLVWVIYV